MSPRTIAERFQIVSLIGEGGMGRVYRTLDRATGAPAAVKLLHPGSVERVRFEREGAILAELSHPGIVRYLAHGRTAQDEAYLAMEWLDGEDLARRLERQELSYGESLTLGLRVAEALHEAHRHGVIHRDIKPANLFLVEGSAQRVKILDFGIARVESEWPTITAVGAMIGTPGYISPEQARGEVDIDARADLFSLGCVLFRCITGRLPFTGNDVLAVLLKMALEEAPRARAHRPSVPEPLDALISRMLAKSPGDRPVDGWSVALALSRLSELTDGASSAPGPMSERPARVTGAEQRLLCVLVARDAAPPDARGLTSDELSAVIERHGGKLHRLIDGSIFITLGTADAATDQAIRAARCALAARPLLPGAAMALVAGRAVLSGVLLEGTVIDRGIQLLEHASAQEPGGAIRVDQAIAGLLDGRFDLRRDAFGTLLIGEPDAALPAFKLLGSPTRCVGRDPEIGRILSCLEECAAESCAHAILVTAPAGMGKSRLRHEILHRARQRGPDGELEIWAGQADMLSAGSPFAILAQVLRSALGLPRGEPMEALRDRIRARAGRLPAGARTGALLGEIVGVPIADDAVDLPSRRADARLLGEQMLRAFLGFLRAEAEAHPVLIVLDDLHWGDVPSISFLDAALRDLAELPILVLAFARPEVHDAFPRLWQSRALSTMQLGALPRRVCERMAREALGQDVKGGVIEAIVARSGGNAFYLEELIRAVADGKGDTLPETVLAMTEARLSVLAPEARRVLRAGSIFGEVFRKAGVRELLGEEAARLADLLADLARREVIERRDEGHLDDDEEYAFRHALVRDAVYGMLTATDRAHGHGLAGEYLERMGGYGPLLLAEHFERAGEHARSRGHYHRAAREAYKGGDHAGAIACAERAIACGAVGEELGELRLLEGEVHHLANRPDEAVSCFAEVLRAAPRRSSSWFVAAGANLMSHVSFGELEKFDALADEIEETPPDPSIFGHNLFLETIVIIYLCAGGRYALARRILDRLERVSGAEEVRIDCWIRWTRYQVAAHMDEDPWRHLKLVEAAVEGFAKATAADEGFTTVGVLTHVALRAVIEHAIVLRSLGAYPEAERILRESIAEASRQGSLFPGNVAQNQLNLVLLATGRLDLALEGAERVIDVYLQGGSRHLIGAARANLARVLMARGDLDGALREALAGADGVVMPSARAGILGVLAAARLARGEAREALAAAGEATALLRRLGSIPYEDALVRLTYAEALMAGGRSDEARAALAEAKERLGLRARTIEDPGLRRSFLEAVEVHRRTLAWELG